MGFFPSMADEDIWMRDMGDNCECLAACVDDLMIASKNPKAIIDALMGAHKLKLKGTGPTTFHLGCDYFRDDDGTLCVGPRWYIEKMCDEHTRMFGEAPRLKHSSPLEKNDHPELDDTELLDAAGIQRYQSLIGTLQWTITLGRIDVAAAVMSVSSFRVAPRIGHLERLQRICGCLSKMRHAFIRIRTEEPDFSDLPQKKYDWARTAYGDVKEEIPHNTPKALGKRVILSHYKDANLYHDMTTGRAVAGVLHVMNQAPVDWHT